MIVYVTTDNAPICGNLWPKGTRLSAPDVAAKAAVANGIATFEAPAAAAPAPVPAAPAEDQEPDEPAKRRGRPRKF